MSHLQACDVLGWAALNAQTYVQSVCSNEASHSASTICAAFKTSIIVCNCLEMLAEHHLYHQWILCTGAEWIYVCSKINEQMQPPDLRGCGSRNSCFMIWRGWVQKSYRRVPCSTASYPALYPAGCMTCQVGRIISQHSERQEMCTLCVSIVFIVCEIICCIIIQVRAHVDLLYPNCWIFTLDCGWTCLCSQWYLPSSLNLKHVILICSEPS